MFATTWLKTFRSIMTLSVVSFLSLPVFWKT